MALDGTYAGLKASVADWLNRSDLTSAIPDFITLAEAQISRRLVMDGPVRSMMATVDVTIDDEFVNLPTDFMGARSFYIQATPAHDLQFCEPEYIALQKSQTDHATGNPCLFSIVGDQFQFFPAPAAGLAGNLTYWQRLPALVNNDTNWLLTTHPDAYLYGALLQSAPYLKDDNRVAIWQNAFATILSDIVTSDRVERHAPFIAVEHVPGGTP